MKKIKDNMICIILGIIFAISFSILSIQLIIGNNFETINIVITALVSFICATYFWWKTSKEHIKFIKNNIVFTTICCILTAVVILQLYITKGMEYKELFENWIFNPFRLRGFVASIIAALYIGTYVGKKIKNWVIEFYRELNEWDKKAYVIATVISFVVIIIAFSFNNNNFLQFDKVYSIDSEWCFEEIFPKATYYDIRHPILSTITFPIWAIAHTIAKILMHGELATLFTAIILQFINSQFLILIGLQLKLLTKNKFIFIMYMLSFTTMLYTVTFEKYQLCVFLVVLYVFSICNKKKSSIPALIGAAGAMPTSCFIGIAELIKNDKFMAKIKRILLIVVVTVFTFICLGRGSILKTAIPEILSTRNDFSNKTYTIPEKIISTTKVFQSSIMSLPSNVQTEENIYWWEGLESRISIIAIAVIILTAIGAIVNRKELFVKISAIWSMFTIVLFIILNWSTQESPLFTIYFSWAIIPLFVMGIDFISKKLKINTKIIYTIITIFVVVVNIITLLDIQKFLIQL